MKTRTVLNLTIMKVRAYFGSLVPFGEKNGEGKKQGGLVAQKGEWGRIKAESSLWTQLTVLVGVWKVLWTSAASV